MAGLGIRTEKFVGIVQAINVFPPSARKWFEERHLHKLALAGLLKTHPMQAALAFVPPFPPPPEPARVPAQKHEAEPETEKERFIFKVVENVVIAWRLFTTFKQRGRLTPQDIVQEKESVRLKPDQAGTKIPQQHVATQEHRYNTHLVAPNSHDHEVEAPHHSHGGTIDLKKIRPQTKEALHAGHTVNLKRP